MRSERRPVNPSPPPHEAGPAAAGRAGRGGAAGRGDEGGRPSWRPRGRGPGQRDHGRRGPAQRGAPDGGAGWAESGAGERSTWRRRPLRLWRSRWGESPALAAGRLRSTPRPTWRMFSRRTSIRRSGDCAAAGAAGHPGRRPARRGPPSRAPTRSARRCWCAETRPAREPLRRAIHVASHARPRCRGRAGGYTNLARGPARPRLYSDQRGARKRRGAQLLPKSAGPRRELGLLHARLARPLPVRAQAGGGAAGDEVAQLLSGRRADHRAQDPADRPTNPRGAARRTEPETVTLIDELALGSARSSSRQARGGRCSRSRPCSRWLPSPGLAGRLAAARRRPRGGYHRALELPKHRGPRRA